MASKEHNLVKLLETLYLSDYTELKKYKNLCRDLKDFYFSRRYASDDYEFLSDDEYKEYIDNFYDLLNELKVIRNSI
ncbi:MULTISPECIES: HEPN domain-containing protein [Clostridium]|uniref:HEPN domain-containing protein n=1 Tax=Clostridium TaxID=1485 RepID=UPI002079BE0E|nr:HEPN domain-containing protein [Clostridium botulinum]